MSQTDQTVPVARGARLSVESRMGDVTIRSWSRDAVRVRARHSQETRIAVRALAGSVDVNSSSSQGPGPVEYTIDVPAWMPVKVDGQFTDISVEGTQSEVSAESVRGDIVIRGGIGFVSGTSVEGDVKVASARARITVKSINQGVSVQDSGGDIIAETVNGPIRMIAIEAGSVDATTVNGHVTYEGSAAPRGKYRLSSHNGNIAVALPEAADATFSVRTYNGTFHTDLPVRRGGDTGRGRRAIYTLGSGGAEFQLESFGGTIRLGRQAGLPAGFKDREKDIRKGKDKDRDSPAP